MEQLQPGNSVTTNPVTTQMHWRDGKHPVSERQSLTSIFYPQSFHQDNSRENIVARRERYLSVLVEVQRQLLVAASEEEIYHQVLQPLGQVSDASRVYVFVNSFNAAGQRVTSQRAEWCAEGIRSELNNPLLQNQVYEDWFPRWHQVLAQGGVIAGLTAELPESEQGLLRSLDILSVLILPLLVGGKFFGFIGFDHCVEARVWESSEVDLLAAVAAAIALALERKRAEDALRQQLQQQTDQQRLLAAIASRVRQSLDLDEILVRTVSEVRQFLQTDRVLVYRFHAEEQGVLVAAACTADWTLTTEREIHQSWVRLAGRQPLYEQGLVEVVDDVKQAGLQADYVQLMEHLQIRAKLVVPILQGEQLWGVLAVHQCGGPRHWQLFEIDLLEQLATQVGIAIQQAQLFSQVQQQAQREQLLNQISQSLNSSLDPQYILQEIVERTGQCFSVDRALIFALGEQIQVCQEWRSSPQVASMLNFQTPLTALPELMDPDVTLRQRWAFHAPFYHQEPGTAVRQVLTEQFQVCSVLAVPILLRDHPFGMLSLHTVTQTRCFTPEEIQLLQGIADQAAIALYNAQSYEHLEQLVKERTRELEQEKILSESANLAKTQFLATMSHELRTPLNAVLGLSDVLQQELFGPLNAKQADYIQHIHRSGDHLLQLINDILDLAKVESGQETVTLAPVNIPELSRYCLKLVQEQAFHHGLQLVCQLDPDIHAFIADERRLRQMLLNLLSNAVKFTPAGQVSLAVEKRPQGLAFIVTDTGIGIPPEKLPLLFQPFSQLDSQLNRQYPGTGLGLALTRHLAQLHGGNITVESVLGEGSRFTLYLPHLELEEMGPERTSTDDRGCSLSSQSGSWKPGRILIVEDEQTNAMLLQDYLQVIGYQVEHMSDSVGFLERVRCFQPHLILMDGQLPGDRTGLDLLRELQSHADLCDIPVAMVTAMAMAGDREKFLAAGATDYLSKPLEIVNLEALLMKHFSG